MNYNNLKIKSNVVSYDCETTGLISYGDEKRWGHFPARPFAFSFFDEDGNSAFFRLEVDPFTRRVIPIKSVLNEIGAILGNKKICKVGHNLNYDIRMARLMAIPFAGPIEDTLIMAHVVTGGAELSYQLKDLGVKYLDISKDDEIALEEATKKIRRKAKKLGWKIAEGEAFGKKPHKADTWMAPPELLEAYAVRDAERTIMAKMLWLDEILKDPQHARVYAREMRLFPIVGRMENRGARVFPEHLKILRKFYQAYMDKWRIEADKYGGKGMNFNSPPQLRQKFIKEKGYQPLKATGKGTPKVDGAFLQSIANRGDKLAKAVLEYNGGAKMINTFIEPYERFRVPEGKNWVLHPNYKQCGPVTGRFSCGEPNLMQVASPDGGKKRTEVELRPREAFGPRPGYIWYLPDYSQIEVWLFAYSAQEPAMIKALLSGHDFHGAIARQVWGDRPDFEKNWVHYRKRGKLIMFCKIYGGGAQAVADLLGCTKEEAAGFIQEYDSMFPGVRTFMKRMVNRVEREGKIYNPFGRVYYIDSRFSYKATNYFIQGSAADIMKEAMIAVDNVLKKWPGSELLLTLHDELIPEIPLKFHCKKLMRQIVLAMQGDFHKPFNMPNPLPVSMKIATKRWSDTLEIKL